jgi:hypothetical protein
MILDDTDIKLLIATGLFSAGCAGYIACIILLILEHKRWRRDNKR